MLADVNTRVRDSMPPGEGVGPSDRPCLDQSESRESRRVKRQKGIPRISYKVAEASDASGIGAGVLYAAIRRNQLKAYQPTPKGQMIVMLEDLIAYITRFPVNGVESNATESQDLPAAE